MNDKTAAFSLVEVVIAIGVVVFAILGVIALLPVGLREARNSTEETQAMYLASLVAADLAAAQPQSASSPQFGLSPIPWAIGLQTGVDYTFYADDFQHLTATAQPDSRYRVTLRYTRAVPLAAVEGLLVVSWPPALDPFSSDRRPMGMAELFLTFPRP